MKKMVLKQLNNQLLCRLSTYLIFWSFWYGWHRPTTAFSVKNVAAVTSSAKASSFPTFADLQKCVTPDEMLKVIGKDLPLGTSNEKILLLSSTMLVRLSKQMVSLDNQYNYANTQKAGNINDYKYQDWSWNPLENAVNALVSNGSWSLSDKSLEAAIEGTKSAAIIARLCPTNSKQFFIPIIQEWHNVGKKTDLIDRLQPHQLSGLKWAMDSFHCAGIPNVSLPDNIQKAYDDLNLPFTIWPGAMSNIEELNVPHLLDQVNFQLDTIKTASNKVVHERRETAWEGDESVAPFEYSGKSMPRSPWSPVVQAARDCLFEKTGVYYDGCLLNHYPDGGSGMRYHIDPDQGTLWDFSTTVVSVGATRKFAFRKIDTHGSSEKPHVFTLMQGDYTEMFADCQTRFQHTVKTAETANEQASRASLVFKKTL